MRKIRIRRPRISRDSILFTTGIFGIVYETVIQRTDRPTLLVLFATMVGLPAFLRADEPEKKEPPAPRRRRKTGVDDDET